MRVIIIDSRERPKAPHLNPRGPSTGTWYRAPKSIKRSSQVDLSANKTSCGARRRCRSVNGPWKRFLRILEDNRYPQNSSDARAKLGDNAIDAGHYRVRYPTAGISRAKGSHPPSGDYNFNRIRDLYVILVRELPSTLSRELRQAPAR